MIKLRPVAELIPDETNPRKADPARLHILKLSLSKLGFILPVAATSDGLVLSGHQRLTVAKELGFKKVPVQTIAIEDKDIRGINILFNRTTNDIGSLDVGSDILKDLTLSDIIDRANKLPDFSYEWFAINCKTQSIAGIGKDLSHRYDKKAVVAAENFIRKNIQIPIVLSESGQVVNGIHRLFAAKENGIFEWPVIRIKDDIADFALYLLNYLSMDYHVDGDFEDMLRYCAYRRPQNNRGSVPKAYRFWGNGERTLLDKDSYSRDYWLKFRDLHGRSLLDFGSGLSKVAPFLNGKGFNCVDFEPYRINPHADNGVPDPEYSRTKAKEFIDNISNPDLVFDSIFAASVLNSVPHPKDRMCVLAIIHALSSIDTIFYGTCRDISDFHYEYGGIRQANYFAFDSEPGVRLGDALSNPKIQKFHSQEEIDQCFKYFWKTRDYWPGGNVFYFRCKAPIRVNPKVLSEALELEFNLPYKDGSRMNLVKQAKRAFSERLGVKIP